MIMYGIPNCGTVKKARTWLEARGLAYTFHDYKKQGVPVAVLQKVIAQFGWEATLNRKGPTWRNLPDAVKASVTDAASALAVMETAASVIKRPLVEHQGRFVLGFNETEYATFFAVP